jgi:hypothetical protein
MPIAALGDDPNTMGVVPPIAVMVVMMRHIHICRRIHVMGPIDVVMGPLDGAPGISIGVGMHPVVVVERVIVDIAIVRWITNENVVLVVHDVLLVIEEIVMAVRATRRAPTTIRCRMAAPVHVLRCCFSITVMVTSIQRHCAEHQDEIDGDPHAGLQTHDPSQGLAAIEPASRPPTAW